MTVPAYTPAEARDRETFLALLWALAHPGSVQTLPTPSETSALPLIGSALLDLETTFYTPDAALTDVLRRTGARSVPPTAAAYHFYPVLDAGALDAIALAATGTPLRPDESALLIIGCPLTGHPVTLRGPGIHGTIAAPIGALPAAFWALRMAALRYPLGWDAVLVDGQRITGLPRTTRTD